MARKQLTITIHDKNRDEGKRFLITEFSARRAHNWACRALFGMANGGIDIPEGLENQGMAGLAAMGINALSSIKPDIGIPLMDELMECVQILPNPERPEIVRRLIDEDIEEVLTIFKLQKEVLMLHIGFFTTESQ